MKKSIDLLVNGTKVEVRAEPDVPLLEVLRDLLELTGCKYACGEGQCGACTVHVDGLATRSCITPIGTVAGREVRTIEGLADGDRLHPLQEAFLDTGAMQCGYCTAGMIMSAASLLAAKPNPKDAEIVRSMVGNICRCGTYPRIMEAIRRAGAKIREAGR